MASPKMDRSERYTYADYLTWGDDERWELIDGVPYLMASPTPAHQTLLLRIASEFHTRLRGKTCEPFIAPLDLTFRADEQTTTVVQPDFFVMCGTYARDKRIVGVPVLIIEILSPSTASQDLVRKMNLYQKMGVQEYWVVDTDISTVYVYRHDGAHLEFTAERVIGDTLSPSMFQDLSINVRTLFE